jgi:glycosyltransferase involved in cell wall biosynthesis
MNLHVLILPSSYPTKASSTKGIFFREQAEALHQAGVKVGVIYPEFRSLRELSGSALLDNHFQIKFNMEKGIPTYRYYGWNIPRLRLEPIMWRRQSKRLFRHYLNRFGKPDLIHAHRILWGGVSAVSIAEEMDLPVVVTEHSSSFLSGQIQRWQEPYLRQVINKVDYMFAVSSRLAEHIKPYADGRRIGVVPNVVDTTFFVPPPVPRRKLPFRILTVALLSPIKGIDTLLKAFAQAFNRNDEVVLEIGGDGPQKKALQDLAKNLHIEHQVRFLGLLSREQVRAAMWRANIFALPSYVETFGVVLIEAMAVGLPVIATSCGGPEDFIEPGLGWLTKPGDISELADALRQAYLNYDEVCRQKPKIRSYAINHFSGDVIANTLMKYYNKLLDSGSD